MLEEYGRVRVIETGMYGTIVDWRPGDNHCEVELDGWQHEGQIDGGRQFPYTFMVTGLEELIEVGREGRRALFDDFDTLVVSSRCYMNLFRSPIIVIRRIGNDVEVIVQSWGLDTNEKKTVRGSEAAIVVSSVFATHADRWVDLFAPEYAVSDGYLWTMTVYSGSRFFACEGATSLRSSWSISFMQSPMLVCRLLGMVVRSFFRMKANPTTYNEGSYG